MTFIAILLIGTGGVLTLTWMILTLTRNEPAWVDDNVLVTIFMFFGLVPIMGLMVSLGVYLGGWLGFWRALSWVGGPMVALYFLIQAFDIWRNDDSPYVALLFAVAGIVYELVVGIQILAYIYGGTSMWFTWLLSHF
jgi:hypothetical protein